MAEGLKVRLVRCPKCDNLLPELPDYCVYQCGGCGTVLRAKKKAAVTDELSEKSVEERVVEGSENVDSIAGENGVSVVIVPETELGGDGIDHGAKAQRVLKERAVDSIASSSLRSQNLEAFSDTDRNKGRETIDKRLKQTTVNKDFGHENRWGRSLNRPISNWAYGDGNGINLDRSKLHDLRVEKEPGEIMHPNGSLRLRETTYRRGMERDGREELYGNSMSVGERGRFPAIVDPNERHLNNHPGYVNRNDLMKNHDYMDGPQRIENLEHDRAELRRKLDDLKDQLSRSCDLADNPKEMLLVDRRMVPPDPYRSNDIYMSQPSAQGNAVSRPPYINRSHGPVSSVNRHGIDNRNFYPPPRRAPIAIPGYEDPFRPRMPKRPPQPSSSHYRSRSSYNNISGQYLDSSQDPLAPFPHETCLYHPSGSCLHSNYRNWQVHAQGDYCVFENRRFHEDSTLPNFYDDVDVNRVNFGPRYHPKGVNTSQLHSQYPQPHKRSPSDLDSNFGGTSQYRPRRVVVSHGNRRLCRPLAGGAPFLTCYNCLKLLKVPRRIMLMEKNKRKLKCGACATIILFEAKNKGLIVSNPLPTKPIHAEVDDGSGEVLNENWRDSHDFTSAGGKTSCPDAANSPRNFQSTDTEANLLSNDMSNSENRQRPRYLSPISSEEKESPDSVIVHKDVSSLADLSSKDYMSPPLSVSPIKDICSNHTASRFENGNKSNRTNQENVILNNSTSRHNTVKDVSVASEIEVSLDEYSITGLSQDSAEVSKENHLPKVNKGSRSFFATLIKKSFRDFSRSGQGVDTVRATNVSVNGQPISYRVVEKAEKLAGPIQNGEYWYDFRAGFWGVMGQPCNGIIPPYIQEFDYPMPEKCGAGNTGVYVNGRELHQKDLDLLVSRGLPSTRNKYYIVEISGKVMDEESGKELNNIGKLAPTVERMRQGFGMKVPQEAV